LPDPRFSPGLNSFQVCRARPRKSEALDLTKFDLGCHRFAIVLAALPGQIRRFLQTGEPYLFSHHFFEDMLARLSGPGRLRFILQPAIALFLGIRDGI
jgi:hypothetical protein